MIRVGVSVEGPTEETFLKEALVEHLSTMGIHLYPVVLGGDVTVERLASQMAVLFWNHDYVTSLVDFYGFQQKGNSTPQELEELVKEAVREKVRHDWNRTRVLPYVQRYEFEALLFSDPRAFSVLRYASEEAVSDLRSIGLQYATPEEIDDSPDMAPSKRIQRAIPRYDKVVDGSRVAKAIGLELIRAKCRRFNEWVTGLESLTKEATSS